MILEGMNFAMELGYAHVVIEGDSKNITDKLLSQSVDLAPVGILVHDIKRGC